MPHAVDPTLAAWQAENHELGMLVFFPSDAAAEQFPYYELPANATFLGLMEADALCLTEDGGVVVYDHEVNGVLCPAASSQTAFLSALAVLQQHFAKSVADEAYYRNESAAVSARVQASEMAGGEEYSSFYCMMVGA